MGHRGPGRLAARLVVLVALCSWCGTASAFFAWMRKGTESPPPPPPPPLSPGPDEYTPPFEMSVADEKFLAEAKTMELSPLDTCHYRVVAQLKSTCSGLSEEQLAKLGVVLFNCQSEVEGRRTFPCTEEMTLKECTAAMDSDTWNAYHIVSNRARSVCYATRQQHFRRKAELTVNALISTATSQLEAMQDLKEGQLELRELTVASLEKLLQGHSALQEQQGALQQGQDQLETSISSNLQRLGQEKALIASGQELVAQLIQGITQRMENVSEQLKGQGSDLQEGHRAILDDLAEVRGRAQDIYSKIEHNLSGFLRHQNRTARYYSDLMGKLERMNGTLGYMLLYLDNMQSRLEDRLHLIQRYLGQAGLSLSALWTCAVHAGYFLLAALLLSFLHCPFFSRAALLVTVPLNALAELNQQPALDLPSLSLLLLTLSLGHWFLQQLLWGCSRLRGKGARSAPLPPTETPVPRGRPSQCPRLRSSTPDCDLLDGVMAPDPLDQDSFAFDDPCVAPQFTRIEDPRFLPPVLGTLSHSTPRLKSRPSFPGGGLGALEGIPQRNLGLALDGAGDSRSASPNQSVFSNSSASGRQLCHGTTKTGLPCKKRALLGQDYCRIHEGGYTSYNPM
ncbi:protein brambleberry isoform X2 [Anguilla anguilla]|uniref:protein brambleberry isoform X2 n=1 Tax=Anguilla anguilla TaxID=7936 RepID=UPI0015AB8A7F|nr:protein brambleberry isoform X2 [Anguilla anguilla]